jgi:predicted ATPase/class 3 adenylate cyclase
LLTNPSKGLSVGSFGVADLPTGTVSFLFTDIEASTRLLQQLGDAYGGLLDDHHRILQRAIEDAGGVRVSTDGDGVFGAFSRAGDAVTAAASAQLELKQKDWPSDVEVRVRMGIHTGDGDIGPDGYRGLDVHRAARISAASSGGQVLVSDATRSLVESSLQKHLGLRDLGYHRLKDLNDPEHIFQLLIDGLQSAFPALTPLDDVRNNLPLQLTSFVGREAELDELKDLLEANRLITLTGVGGTGKTRMAYKVADGAKRQFPDGVWVAELARISDPNLVANELATEMGVRPQPGEAIARTLASVVQHQKVLIILDNCEHLLDASAELSSDLLHAGPKVKVIATSREALGVVGEVSYPVASLGLPKGEIADDEDVLRFDAVELFAERAALIKPGFSVTERNVRAVVQICRRLDGVPLAIELAAARVRALSPKDIADHLDDRFRLLTGGSRTALPRQQTLEATVAWSYDHLTEPEQLVFGRLSVFSGGFTMETAALVCAGDGLEVFDVDDLVLGLIDKSMIVIEEDETGSRYRLLETLRQYARDRLAERSDPDQLRRKHAEVFVGLAERLDNSLRGPNQVVAVRQMGAEHDNLRIALTWAQDAGEPVLVLRLVAALGLFWDLAGHWTEGRAWMSQAPFEHEDLPLDLRIEATLGGLTMVISDDKEKGAELAEQVMDQAVRLDEPLHLGRALSAYGYAIAWMGKTDESLEALERAVELCRDENDPWMLAHALLTLGNVVGRTQPDRAVEAELEGLDIFRSLGDRLQVADALYLLGATTQEDNPDDAASWLEESLQLAREVGSPSREGHALLQLGMVKRSEGDDDTYQTLLEALQHLTDVGDRHCAANTEREMAMVDLADDPGLAEQRLRRALTTAASVKDRANTALSLEAIAKLIVRDGRYETAVKLYAASKPLMSKSSQTHSRTSLADREPEFGLTKEQLDETAYQKAWDAGSAMTEDEAVQFALSQSTS